MTFGELQEQIVALGITLSGVNFQGDQYHAIASKGSIVMLGSGDDLESAIRAALEGFRAEWAKQL